jgi:hypothetical protein
MAEGQGTNTGQADRTRRALLKTGAILVPTIVTLNASPAWASTDYTMVAYRYGTNAGLCRNPNFQAGSSSPWKMNEFMSCDQIVRSTATETESLASGSGTQSIQF